MENARRAIPEGRHSMPEPEKELLAPVADSENVHSRGKYAITVVVRVRILED